MASMIATILRWLGVLACLFMLASFIAFVHDQSSSATEEQVSIIGGQDADFARQQPTTERHSDVRLKVDDANEFLAQPFEWLTANASSQWVKRMVTLALGLFVYGFGVFWLARAIPRSKPREPSAWET